MSKKKQIFSLDAVAKQVAEIINERPTNKTPMDILSSAVDVFFIKYDDDIHGDYIEITYNANGKVTNVVFHKIKD